MTSQKQFVAGPLLTVAEAAKYLGVGRKVVYRLLEEGRLTEVRVGRSTRIEKQALDRFKESGQLT